MLCRATAQLWLDEGAVEESVIAALHGGLPLASLAASALLVALGSARRPLRPALLAVALIAWPGRQWSRA